METVVALKHPLGRHIVSELLLLSLNTLEPLPSHMLSSCATAPGRTDQLSTCPSLSFLQFHLASAYCLRAEG